MTVERTEVEYRSHTWPRLMAPTTGQRRVQECAGATDFFSFTTWHHAFRELKRVFLLRLNRIVISRANNGGIVPPFHRVMLES